MAGEIQLGRFCWWNEASIEHLQVSVLSRVVRGGGRGGGRSYKSDPHGVVLDGLL